MCTIREAKEQLKIGISTYLSRDMAGQYKMPLISRIPFYLEGPPGIGKSEIVKQVSEELGIGYVGFSITHHTRNTVLGLPIIKEIELNHTKCSYSEFTISEIIAKVWEQVQEGFTEGILMLDEFSCMSETLFPVMLAFLQTRNIGMYSLPEGWIIVLAGNPVKYNSSARAMDFAIMDRIRRIEVEFSTKAFMEYAKERKFCTEIIEFLELNRNDIYKVQRENGKESLVTSRGWENLSHFIKAVADTTIIDEILIRQYIKDIDIAKKFAYFIKNYEYSISKNTMDKILNGEEPDDKEIEQYKQLQFDKKCGLVKKFITYVEQKGNCQDLENDIVYGKRFLMSRKKRRNKDEETIFSMEAAIKDKLMSATIQESEIKALTNLQEHLYEYRQLGLKGQECLRLLENWVKERKMEKDVAVTIQSDRISKMLQFIEEIAEEAVRKIAFNAINSSKEMLECLASMSNQEYIKLGQEFYEVGVG